MFLTDEQILSIAVDMYVEHEEYFHKRYDMEFIPWGRITEEHQETWVNTARQAVKFAAPIFEAKFTAELEEIFTGFMQGFLEARKLRNEAKVEKSIDAIKMELLS